MHLETESSGGRAVAEVLENSSLVASLENLNLRVDQSPKFVDTEAKIANLVGRLQNLPTKPPSLYIDLEGVNLSRYGSISILQIYVLPHEETYLVDIHSLQKKAFSQTASDKGQTLLDILESPDIPKVFFDVRNDSDALFSHFNVKLAGVIDLQLMELATRYYPKKFVSGLTKCIEKDASLTTYESRYWKVSKEQGLKLFAPERGGSYEVFNVRPLPDKIKEYCVQDVRFLPKLWVQYNQKISPSWDRKVTTETKNRVTLSQTATYDGRGKWKALAPVGWY
jgi:exonuclease 3'-5' domain-containing protein 1